MDQKFLNVVKNTTKYSNPVLLLLGFIAFLVSGIVIIIHGLETYKLLYFIGFLALLFTMISSIFSWIRKKHYKRGILTFFLYLLLLAFIISNPIFFGASLPFILGLWSLVNAGLRLLLFIQSIFMDLTGKIRHLLAFLISLGFGVLLVVEPISQIDNLAFFAGLYLILYSFTLFGDFAEDIMGFKKIRNSVGRRFRMPLPLFIVAFIPKWLILEWNKYFEELDPDAISYLYKETKEEKEIPLEIFIHLKNDGFEMLGHADICYKGTVYSYGCYDHHSHRLGGFIADGSISVTPREAYIDHCLLYEHKILVSFGIDLDDEQMINVASKLEEIKALFIPWTSDYEKMENGQLAKGEYLDDASQLYKATGAKIYKIKEGKFKKYFALSTNCVMLSDTITNSADLDYLAIKGVVTPGLYYSMLNSMFEREHTPVISRTFYKKKSIK